MERASLRPAQGTPDALCQPQLRRTGPPPGIEGWGGRVPSHGVGQGRRIGTASKEVSGKGAACACRTFFFWSAESALTHNGEGVAATITGKPRCPLPAPSASHRRVTRFGSATEIEGLRDRQREGDQTMTNPVRYSDFELSEDELEWEYQPVCEKVGRMFGNDGRCFMTGDGRSIFAVCQMVARASRRESSSCGTVHRYTFFDDSALVIGPHSWDYAGSHDAREEEECRMAKLRSRSEEHTSELHSLMRISYAVFCLKKKQN